jgi:ABC-type multidrug transport system fused ATPase/permease subunit
MSNIRSLAREAVIFMLLGLLLSSTGTFIYLSRSQSKAHKVLRDVLWENCEGLRTRGSHSISNGGGSYTTPAECSEVFENWAATDWKRQELGNASGSIRPLQLSSEDLDNALSDGKRIKNLKIDSAGHALVALLVGAYGFVAGLGVWFFYRLVRFAVKG